MGKHIRNNWRQWIFYVCAAGVTAYIGRESIYYVAAIATAVIISEARRASTD